MEEPSLGLIRTEILLILESMLSSLIKFMSSNINAVLHQKYVYHPKSTPTLNILSPSKKQKQKRL